MSMSPPPGLLPRSQDFSALWRLSSSEKIGDGGQGEIYKTYPTKLNRKYYFDNNEFVTKIIKLNIFGKNGRERIVNCYSFVKKHKLLNIYGIFHDHSNKQILIVMQYLNHELDEKYLIDTEIFNKRFCRPGHIYINFENCLKLFIKQITKQLKIIHDNKRIHFDLKPQNIMFNEIENKWCIIDYDLMKICNNKRISRKTNKRFISEFDRKRQKQANKENCYNFKYDDNEYQNKNKNNKYNDNDFIELDHYRGTQSWTSPEMAVDAATKGTNIITTKTDIFSFGLIIIYIINKGYQPYLLEHKDVDRVCADLVERPNWRRVMFNNLFISFIFCHG